MMASSIKAIRGWKSSVAKHFHVIYSTCLYSQFAQYLDTSLEKAIKKLTA